MTLATSDGFDLEQTKPRCTWCPSGSLCQAGVSRGAWPQLCGVGEAVVAGLSQSLVSREGLLKNDAVISFVIASSAGSRVAVSRALGEAPGTCLRLEGCRAQTMAPKESTGAGVIRAFR